MRTRTIIFLTCLLTMLCFSCGEDDSGAMAVNAIHTEAVATYVASMAKTPVPHPTISFTPTSLPTFTPAGPASTATNPPPTQNSCYNLIWIEDRSIPDGMQMQPGETFTKTWLVQNNGGCAWGPGFQFRHVGGDPMGGKLVTLQEPIPVGAKRELSVDLVAPGGTTGLIQSAWRMSDDNGNYFGDTLTVKITLNDQDSSPGTNTP
jgi:hypothetical protein